MSMSKVVERAVELLCKHYKLPVEEAKSVVKNKKTKKMISKPSTLIPFLGKVDGWCDGLKLSHGIYSQCTNKPMSTGELCKTCQKQADANEHGKPNCGLASERADDMENWRDPKNRSPTHFGNIVMKMELDVDAVVAECKRVYALEDDYELPSELFEAKKQGRGRPKKVNPIVGDTDDEGEPAKKPRGRPKKATKTVVDVTNNGDDLISTLVAQAKQASEEQSVSESEVVSASESDVESSIGSESEGESEGESKVEEKKPVKKATKKGKLSEEEKAAAKAAKEAEKEKKAAAKEAEKQRKAEEKKAAKEAEKAKKAEEKKAAKEAEKQKKAEEKKAAKAVKKAEEQKPTVTEEDLKAEAEELSADEPVSDSEDEVRVELKTIDGVEYLIDDDGVVYDKNTQEPIGTYVADEDRIEECEFDAPELERS